MHSKIDLSEPRHVVYQTFESSPGPCPQCGEHLRKSRETYSVSTRRGRRVMDSFVVGSDFGWYCGACPVVVIDSLKLDQMLRQSLPHWEVGNESRVEGLVDLDAIPKDKRHLPIGGPENPVPLMKFIDASKEPPQERLNKKERQRRKKRLLQNSKGGVR
jgi:hypothetical protein